MPKLILRSYDSLFGEFAAYAREPGTARAGSCSLCLVPVSHSFGLISATLHTLIAGGAAVFPRTLSPRDIVDALVARQVTHVFGVPFHFKLILGELARRRAELPSRLVLLSSGGRLDPALAREYRERLGLRLGQQYGMSEVGYIATSCTDAHPSESVGAIAAHHRWQITEEGQLALWLPHSPYALAQPNWAAEAQGDGGWLFTQDRARLGEDETLFITGRTNDQVSVSGLKVELPEIESALRQHPEISDCCVVAHDHPVLGAALEAFFVWRSDQGDVATLHRWLGDRLAPHKLPRRYTPIAAIPMSPAGKVLKSRLPAAQPTEVALC